MKKFSSREDKLFVPTLPNAPMEKKDDEYGMGEIKLRKNLDLDFVENFLFNDKLISYDFKYQNSLVNSAYFFKHMSNVIETLKKYFPKNSKVIEVGCGKGDFVEMLIKDGYFDVEGYDAIYEGDNPKIYKRYLNEADRIDADVIILRHVLEHIQNPYTFLDMLKNIFISSSIYIEVPNYDWIIESDAFFDITYEHVNYFSQKSLKALFEDGNLISGLAFNNQYQYTISKIELLSPSFIRTYEGPNWEYVNFHGLFPKIKKTMEEIEKSIGPFGKFYIWGAATKGCMFLVHCLSKESLIKRVGFAIDINPRKQNKFLPASLVCIKSKEQFFSDVREGDLLIITNQNYEKEIMNELYSQNLYDLKVICL
jgi:hypothetical protein